MSGPWNAQQVEWLQALGLEVLHLSAGGMHAKFGGPHALSGSDVPAGLMRAARGVDVVPLLTSLGTPTDVVSRRAFWRALRPLRKAASGR